MANKQIRAYIDAEGREETFEIDHYPDACPLCHHKIEPVKKFTRRDKRGIQIVFACPNRECDELFLGRYTQSGSGLRYTENYFLRECSPWRAEDRVFPEEIKSISVMFVGVYNEAEEAEQRGLKNICGAGYRRALEFLVKDYLIQEIKLDIEKVGNIPLGKCIDDYVGDKRIKSCAKRAAWLGNDQTHYYRKWENKDLADLKTLIELTVNWMHSEYLTKKFAIEMPEDKPKNI